MSQTDKSEGLNWHYKKFFFSFFKSKFWFFPSFLKGLTSTIPGYLKTKEIKGIDLTKKTQLLHTFPVIHLSPKVRGTCPQFHYHTSPPGCTFSWGFLAGLFYLWLGIIFLRRKTVPIRGDPESTLGWQMLYKWNIFTITATVLFWIGLYHHN